MKHEMIGKWSISRFTSTADYANRAAMRPGFTPLPEGSGTSSMDLERGRSWSGGLDLDECLALTREGWTDEAPELERFVTEASVFARQAMIDEAYRATDCPDSAVDLDVGAYVAGDPDHWISLEADRYGSVRSPMRQLRIGVGTAWSAGVDAGTIVETTSVAIGLALGVQAFGVPVTLDAIKHTRGSPGRRSEAHDGYTHIIPLLGPGRTLDHARLAAVCHSGFSRRLGFAVSELDGHSPVATRVSSYGWPCKMSGTPAAVRDALNYDVVIEEQRRMDKATLTRAIHSAVKLAQSPRKAAR